MGNIIATPGLATVTQPEPDFEATVAFLSPPPAVFEALTTADGLSSWWVPASGSGLAGGELVFVMGTARVLMRVDEADPPSAVTWTNLVCEPLPDWVGTTISFAVTPDDKGGSRLRFRHRGLKELDCFDQCRAGWNRYFPSLVDHVDTGHGRPLKV